MTRRGEGSSIIAPLERDEALFVGIIGDVTLDFAVFVDESDGAICEPDGCEIADSLGEGHPVVVDGVGVEF